MAWETRIRPLSCLLFALDAQRTSRSTCTVDGRLGNCPASSPMTSSDDDLDLFHAVCLVKLTRNLKRCGCVFDMHWSYFGAIMISEWLIALSKHTPQYGWEHIFIRYCDIIGQWICGAYPEVCRSVSCTRGQGSQISRRSLHKPAAESARFQPQLQCINR